MRTLGFEPSTAKPYETTSSRSDGGPEGVRAASPSHPSLSAIPSRLCHASLRGRDNDTRIQLLASGTMTESSPRTGLPLAKFQ